MKVKLILIRYWSWYTALYLTLTLTHTHTLTHICSLFIYLSLHVLSLFLHLASGYTALYCYTQVTILQWTHKIHPIARPSCRNTLNIHDDVFKWKHFPRYWPFVRGIPRSLWHGALMFSLICAWINGWVNNREADDLRRHRAHYDVTAMCIIFDQDISTVARTVLAAHSHQSAFFGNCICYKHQTHVTEYLFVWYINVWWYVSTNTVMIW